MRNRKMIILLLAGILAHVGAELVVNLCGETPTKRAHSFLVENAFRFPVIELHRRGEPAIVLEKGAGWRLVRPYPADVDERVVMKMLDTLARSQVEEIVTDAELLSRGRTRADFALDDPALRVVLSNTTSVVSLALGLSTPAGDGVYATLDDEQSVLIVPSDLRTAVDLPVDRFRQRDFVREREESIVAFSIKQNPGTLLSFVRTGEDWLLGGQKTSTSVVRRFLQDLTAARVADFVWPTGSSNELSQASAALLAGYGLDPESAVTVTLKTAGGHDVPISFGKASGEGAVYALVHAGGAVVTVPSALKDAALRETGAFVDARLFPREPEKVASISLRDGETTISLSRQASGVWRIDSPISAPADSVIVSELLTRILALTSSAVETDGVLVSLDGGTGVSVRRAILFPSGASPEILRSRDIAVFPAIEIKRLVSADSERTNAAVSVVYSAERRAWNIEKAPEGMIAAEAGVATVLKALAPLRAVRVEKLKVSAEELRDYGLDVPRFTISVDLDREKAVRRNILIGAELEDGARFATIGSAEAVFVLAKETVDALSTPLAARE